MRAASLIGLAATAHAAVPADLVISLPGFEGALPSKLYSGYLSANGGQAHYIFR